MATGLSLPSGIIVSAKPNNTFNTDRPKACAFGSALRERSAGGLT